LQGFQYQIVYSLFEALVVIGGFSSGTGHFWFNLGCFILTGWLILYERFLSAYTNKIISDGRKLTVAGYLPVR